MYKSHYLKFTLFFCIALVLLLNTSSLQAEDFQGRQGPVRVGVLEINKDTNPQSRELLEGYIRSYLRELSKRTHFGYEYISVAPSEGKKMLENGTLDLLAPIQENVSLTPSRIYSNGYAVYGMLSLFTAPGSKLDVMDGSTMKGVTIGYVTAGDNTGYINHYVQTHGWQNINFVTFADGRHMIEALHRGEIQAAMDDGSNLMGDETELAIIAIDTCQFMALPSNQQLINELNDAILDIELKNPSFSTRLEQEYIDPAIHNIAVYSEIEENYVKNAPPIRIVLPGKFSPFIGKRTGIFNGLIEIMGQDSGLTFQIILADNYREARTMLEKGEADIMPCVYYGDNYHNPMNFTNNFMTIEYSAITHADGSFAERPINIVLPANIPGLEEYVKKLHPDWDITTMNTVDDCLEAVERQRFDIALVPNLYLTQHNSLITRPHLKINDKYSCRISLSLMVSEASPEMLVRVLNTAIQRLSPDVINRTIEKNSSPVINFGYLLQEYPIPLGIGILAVLLTVLGIGFVLHNSRQTKKRNILLSEKNDELERALNEVKALTKDRDAYKQEAETDQLTGLLNKKGIALRCSEILANQIEGEAIALLIIDLDHFKEFNDTYGHQQGDELLITFARLLKSCCTDLSAVGRFGGDEFMMMIKLPQGSTAEDIQKQTQWLLTCIKDIRIQGHAANVTGSIGIAITKEIGISYDSLFRHADRALYKVKAAGRDGYQIYEN
ncbi:Sensory box/GGDEF family protein [Anaerovibrio sp. JC8]|uniref:transporter substrate-binding domain-containing diguanylate cyclase n=1 Tax=Anaerovibrio sp. JC8 TaxID=1240085 RepID=UPI000A0C05CA|nr:GGDEF domain-containing protein [Anaerovibrio sp. JC8]ORT99355.1 Sensory box/GGDEF family protein [Anaerovibrio sp. JC8]